jgi:peptidoglycan hydrolase-like protein with peptidoglycan-binding domain
MNLQRFHRGLLLGGLVIAASSCASAAGSATSSSAPGGGQRVPAAVPTADATDTVPATIAAVADTAAVAVAPPVPEAPVTAAPTAPPPPTGAPVPRMDIALPAIGAADGPDTQRLQQRLLDLGFWVSATDGTYGITTRQAVMAFQKYYGLAASGEVDYTTAAFLSQATERARSGNDTETLVEVDKRRQLLFLVNGGVTTWVFNASTGNDQPYEEPDQNDPGKMQKGVSITPEGRFKVDRERPEGWWEGDLGQIYRPKYFKGGVAVHGSSSVPNYPASHGCVRVSVPAMDFIWEQNLIPMRTVVWVHS